MPTIAITGLSGEVGQFLLQEISSKVSVVDLFHTKPTVDSRVVSNFRFNLNDRIRMRRTLKKIHPDVFVHLGAFTHIDACEVDRINGENGIVWQTNVDSTAQIARYCAQTNTHLIFLSTECVFDGVKKSYTKSDHPSPINWYGITKAAAEKVICDSGCSYTILRAVIAYSPTAKSSLWQKISSKLKNGSQVRMANDHWMTPTYFPDIALAIRKCVQKKPRGIFHVSALKLLTPYSFACKIAASLGYSKALIQSVPLESIIGKKKSELRLKFACLDSKESEKALLLHFRSVDEVIRSL
ncbi:MAG: sugar nucleotide-binding protein [Candidatus Woesebacteria bacterium]